MSPSYPGSGDTDGLLIPEFAPRGGITEGRDHIDGVRKGFMSGLSQRDVQDIAGTKDPSTPGIANLGRTELAEGKRTGLGVGGDCNRTNLEAADHLKEPPSIIRGIKPEDQGPSSPFWRLDDAGRGDFHGGEARHRRTQDFLIGCEVVAGGRQFGLQTLVLHPEVAILLFDSGYSLPNIVISGRFENGHSTTAEEAGAEYDEGA